MRWYFAAFMLAAVLLMPASTTLAYNSTDSSNAVANVTYHAARSSRTQPIRTRAATRASLNPIAARVVDLINARRAAAGLAPITVNGTLMAEAQRFSTIQARIGYLSHRGVDGTTAGQRLTRAGYRWSFWGENLAAGQETADAVVAAWMASPSHRANILQAKAREIGIGHTVKDGDPAYYFDYWVMEVGRPR